MRAVWCLTGTRISRRALRAAPRRAPRHDRARIAQMAARIDKAAFTRADMVELVGAQLPVDAPGDPRALIEQIVDEVGVRISAPRDAHHREGHEKFTVDAVIAEEQRVFDMVDEADNRAAWMCVPKTSATCRPTRRAPSATSRSRRFWCSRCRPPPAPAKPIRCKALRAAAHRTRKEVLVLASTGKAVDAALQEGAGDRGLTVAKALHLIVDDKLKVDRHTVVIVDEASMVGTPELEKLLSCAVVGRAKMVLVGDCYQLAPVLARGGMFEQLCDELPWSQRLVEVWRMRDPEERDASLALRCGHGNRLRKAVGWYRTHGRLHTGDPVAMAADALQAYHDDRAAGKDSLLLCDTWEIVDALNRRLHDSGAAATGPTVAAARDQVIGVGDLIMSRNNDATISVQPGRTHRGGRVDQVRNGNRWRVAGVDPATNRVAAERITDRARVVFEGEYLREHVTLGYAVTVHSAQGVTADRCHAIVGEGATRAMLYVAMTRGRGEQPGLHLSTPERRERSRTHRPGLTSSDPPAATRRQILRRPRIPVDPGQRRPPAHHARRSRTDAAASASRHGRRRAGATTSAARRAALSGGNTPPPPTAPSAASTSTSTDWIFDPHRRRAVTGTCRR